MALASARSPLRRHAPCRPAGAREEPARARARGPPLSGRAALRPWALDYRHGQDHRAAVVRPRLRAAEADLDAISDIRLQEEGFEAALVLPLDIAELDACVAEERAKFIVIDPLVAFLDGAIDSWRDASVRQALAPLASLAERRACAVLGIVHLNKGSSGDAFQRIGGSVGFQGAPRSVLVLGRHPEEEERRVLVHSKSNYGREAASLLLAVEPIFLPAEDGGPGIETSRIEERGECGLSMEDILVASPRERGPRLGRAEDWLAEILSDGGWHDSAGVKELAAANGLSERTVKRAAQDLGVEHERRGYPSSTCWRLPPGQRQWAKFQRFRLVQLKKLRIQAKSRPSRAQSARLAS